MCLDRKVAFNPTKMGYKILDKRGDKLCSSLYGKRDNQPLRVWLDERDYRDNYAINKEELHTETSKYLYPIGWHIFHTLEGAERWREDIHWPTCIVKVEVLEPVATGYQDKRRVTVAKKIKILRTVKGGKL